MAVDQAINESSATLVGDLETEFDIKEEILEVGSPVFEALKRRIESIDRDTCEPGDENSFFVCDLSVLTKLHNKWCKELPRVMPFYAVKCNPDERVLRKLAQLGVNFDCASVSEIDAVLSLGVTSDRIIFANPCKANSSIRYSSELNVTMTTFDNVDELHKIKQFNPKMKLFLRIATDDSTAQCRLSTKYGCSMSDVDTLLKTVKDLELNLVGVSFHVGSGAHDLSSLYQSIKDSKAIFDKAEAFGLPKLSMLDIGGGFVYETFEAASKMVRMGLDEFFPLNENQNSSVEIIAEPGRYFVANAFTLAANVIAKKQVSPTESMIYINDGIYGNMNCILFDHQTPVARILFHKNNFAYFGTDTSSLKQNDEFPHKISIWGPTCDGLDCVTKECYMKYEVAVGDWFYFADLGAYTSSAATSFNGFQQQVDVLYV